MIRQRRTRRTLKINHLHCCIGSGTNSNTHIKSITNSTIFLKTARIRAFKSRQDSEKKKIYPPFYFQQVELKQSFLRSPSKASAAGAKKTQHVEFEIPQLSWNICMVKGENTFFNNFHDIHPCGLSGHQVAVS